MLQEVYRLPMRNWNIIDNDVRVEGGPVYRLPMRNWNDRLNTSSLGVYDLVYRLPMRNWNKFQSHLRKRG